MTRRHRHLHHLQACSNNQRLSTMARTSRRMQALTLLLLLGPLAAHAQLSSVPNLSTATTEQGGSTTGKTTDETTAKTTDDATQAKTTQDAKTTQISTFGLTDAPKLETSSSSDDIQNAPTSVTQSAFHLTGLPTIAGAGIPTLVIPYTAGAPFMQKSSLPEGTFFIVIGGILAFIGASILLWRGLVAWSVNRSVRRTALASMQLDEKPRTTSYWGGSNNRGYNRVSAGGRGSFYKDLAVNSTVSLDNLTSAGKPIGKPHYRESVTERNTSNNVPPANLFFSPTAQAAQQRDSYRGSGYMPSGYYASPSSQPAGGHTNTTIGGLAPGNTNTNRHSAAYSQPSPPPSPSLPPQSRGSSAAFRNTNSREGLRGPSRDGFGSARNSAYLYAQPSSSSLMVGGASGSDIAGTGSRAPSAYLEDLFENHGNGPRERF